MPFRFFLASVQEKSCFLLSISFTSECTYQVWLHSRDYSLQTESHPGITWKIFGFQKLRPHQDKNISGAMMQEPTFVLIISDCPSMRSQDRKNVTRIFITLATYQNHVDNAIIGNPTLWSFLIQAILICTELWEPNMGKIMKHNYSVCGHSQNVWLLMLFGENFIQYLEKHNDSMFLHIAVFIAGFSEYQMTIYS